MRYNNLVFDEITTVRESVKTTKPSRRVALEGTKVLVDPATGEEFRVGHMAVTDADANFSKIWLANLLLAVEEFGSASMAVLFWLVKKTEETRGKNTIYMTIREIAAEVGKSTQTVHKVLRILETHDIIRRKTGVIFVSPEVIYKGTHTGRMHVLTTYRAVEKADLEEDDVRTRVERRAQELKRISEQYDYVRKLMEADLDALEKEADAAAE